MTETRFHNLSDGRKIAFRHVPGTGPTLVFLPGYMSDMAGGKATAVFDWACAQGRACLLLDYSGCGESSGTFAGGTLSRWRRPEDLAKDIVARNEQLKWCDTSRRGYLAVELTPTAALGEWRFLANVRQRGTALAGTKGMVVLAGQRRFSV